MGSLFSGPKAQGPSQEEVQARKRTQENLARERSETARRKHVSGSRRFGRRSLIATSEKGLPEKLRG